MACRGQFTDEPSTARTLVVPDDAPRCAGCGNRDPPLHELSTGIFACDRCIAVTLGALAKKAENEGRSP